MNIRKKRVLNAIPKKTIKRILKNKFQNQYNEFSKIVLEEYGKKVTDTLNSKLYNEINARADEILKDILGKDDITNIITGRKTIVNHKELGITNIDDIGNNEILYFRTFNPIKENLIFSIIYILNNLKHDTLIDNPLYVKNKNEIQAELGKLQGNPNLEKLLEFSTEEIPFDDIDVLIELVDLLENILGINIILLGHHIGKYASTKIYLNEHKISKKDRDIIVLYFYNNKNRFMFNPVINISLKTKIQRNTISREDHSNFELQTTHFIEQFQSQSKQKRGKVSINKKTINKFKVSNQIVKFNPYDKDKLLPKIQLNHPKGELTYLLGHEIDGYQVLYEIKGSNKIAGKVILNNPKKGNCSVFLCK